MNGFPGANDKRSSLRRFGPPGDRQNLELNFRRALITGHQPAQQTSYGAERDRRYRLLIIPDKPIER